MKKLLSVMIAASFFAATPLMAAEETVATDNDQISVANDVDEFDMAFDSADAQTLAENPDVNQWRCPRGWRAVPRYRWDRYRHRWVIVGYRCSRYGHGYPGYPPGHGGYPGYPGHGRGGGYPGHGGGHHGGY
jgi:Ni/Co efflux regulator RcnB